MRTVLAVLLLSASMAACAQPDDAHTRGVGLVSPSRAPAQPPRPFDATESAALFVGVRDFPEKTIGEVRYTVDDAVDLAYVMAFDRKVQLVSADRVVLAISDEPVKEESKHRLRKLIARGATCTKADRDTVNKQLEQQAALAGKNGVLILFFASHGFTSDGTGYVLTSTSTFNDERSSLSTARIFDIAARSPAERSLIFIDACRERIPDNRRSPYYQPGGRVPMIKAMTPAHGQVIFYAATPGDWAFEDMQKKNGVFTRAIIDTLSRCDADKSQGMITVATLAKRIDERVRAWMKRIRGETRRSATQVQMGVYTMALPLAHCGPPPVPARIETSGASFRVFDDQDQELWTSAAKADVTVTRIADLDDDKSLQVVIGDRSGTITVFTADGNREWSERTLKDMSVSALAIDYLLGKKHKRHIVALSNAANGKSSALTVYTSDGTLHGQYRHDGRLFHVAIDRLTASHDPHIIVAGTGSIFMFDKRVKNDWQYALVPEPKAVLELKTRDVNEDRRCDIELRTTNETIYLNFDGNRIKPSASHSRDRG